MLTALPVGPRRPATTVGPTFDIARPAVFGLPHRESAWQIINDRLDQFEGDLRRARRATRAG